MDKLGYILLLLTISLVIFAVIEQKTINTLKGEAALLGSNFQSYKTLAEEKILSYSKSLEQSERTNQELNVTIKKLETEKRLLEQGNRELGNKINLVKSELEQFEAKINNSLSWFGVNKQLGDGYYEDAIKRDLANNCINKKEGLCYLKTSCPYFVNKQYSEFKYLGDRFTSNATDKMQSLKEFIAHNGGDCEDYALFYKAEWNYLLDLCDGLPITIESYIDGGEDYFVTYRESWYIKSKQPIYFSDSRDKAVIICGNMFDINSGKTNGHCMIAMIDGAGDIIKNLDLANIIEPQNGMYYGKLNDKSSGIYLPEQDKALPDSYIYMVVTDEDLFLFDNNRWKSYIDFLDQAKKLRSELDK